ncbi:MAG TPA: exo-alpha-sialidase [Gammaproteobacteria bacterium]|nr:exo-alpha-sialidase [Gammaproteobacteria bacterium]
MKVSGFGLWRIAITLAALLLQGCGQTPQPQVKTGLAGLEAVKSLDVYADGDTLHLLLAGPSGGNTVMRYLQSSDGGMSWTAPVTIDAGHAPPYGVHRGDDARIAASGPHLVATWPTQGSGWGGSGPMASAISDDGGQSWHPGGNPAGDASLSEAFIDLAAGPGGIFHAVWLDSRHGQQGLQYAHSSDGGEHWSNVLTIDPATCQCCWNTLRPAPGEGVYVLYRNVDPRDMGLAASNDGGASWQRRGPVGAFDWQFDACPHTGGGLAVTGGSAAPVLHAVVWSGKRGELGLHYLVSSDGGRSWLALGRLGDDTARHVDLAALDGQHLAAVWDAATEAGSGIFAARSHDGGKTWGQPRGLSAPRAQAEHPRIVATADGYRIFWTQRNGAWAVVGLPR